MWFHAPREIIEHPTILLDSLCAGGIPVQLDNSQCCLVGHLDELDVRIQLHSKRLHVNLSVCIGVSGTSVPANRMSTLFAKHSEAELTAVLRAINDEHHMRSAVADRISAILGKAGISVVHSPIEDELGVVTKQFGTKCNIEGIVFAIRKQQELVSCSVNTQQFEDAAWHRDERERLLDGLYDLCTNESRSTSESGKSA